MGIEITQVDPEVEFLLGEGTGKPMAMGGAYEGASRFDREMALWQPSMASADMDLLSDKPIMDARARDQARNDAYLMGGVQLHRDNIVGSHFLLNAKPNYKILGLDEAWAEEFQELVEGKFTLWAESPDNHPDASRMNTLTGLVRLAMAQYVMAGEVLSSVEWLRQNLRPYSTAVQLIDPDRLSNPDGQPDSRTLRRGVRRDKFGAPIGYWVRVAHPGDALIDPTDSYRWKYVPARKPWGRVQMIHIVEQFRPDQSRGVSEMVSALKEMKMTKKFRDVVLQNAVVNATYAASIESDLPSEAVFAALGEGGFDQWTQQYLQTLAAYTGGAKNLHIDGVKIPHLFPGTKMNLQTAGTPGGVGTGFEESLLRYISASLGVSYEQLSRDYTKTNYSSARAAMAETWKYMQARKRVVADRFASMIYRLWLEEAINKGEIELPPGVSIYGKHGLNQNFDALAACEWVGASRGQIDELKETQAAVLRLNAGLSTQEDELARLGKDWRQVITQRAREKRKLEEHGLQNDLETYNARGTGSDREQSQQEDDTDE